MSQELHYTSVPRGLLPGTRGFCAVAVTPNMTGPLRERLESLSGYRQVFPPHDASESLNPVVYSHHRLSLGGRSYSILSRIASAGLDYTSRSNKYAHHVVLDPDERPPGGPAWLLSQPGFMETAWRGDPRLLDAGRVPPQGDRSGGVAHAWAALTGDAGWAGVLAESFLADPQRPALLIFEPGMDLLPLYVEALALLPPSRRWDVEFSTYFTQLPSGLSCSWRGLVAESAEAKTARRLPNALVFDLREKSASSSAGRLATFARTGSAAAQVAGPADLPKAPQLAPTAGPIPGSREPIFSTGSASRSTPYPLVEIPEIEPLAHLNLDRRPAGTADSRPGKRRRFKKVVALLVLPLLAGGLATLAMVAGSLPRLEWGAIGNFLMGRSSAHKMISDAAKLTEKESPEKQDAGEAKNSADTTPGARPARAEENTKKAAPGPIENMTDAGREEKKGQPAPEEKKGENAKASDLPNQGSSQSPLPAQPKRAVGFSKAVVYPLKEPRTLLVDHKQPEPPWMSDPALQIESLKLHMSDGTLIRKLPKPGADPKTEVLEVWTKPKSASGLAPPETLVAKFDFSLRSQIDFQWNTDPDLLGKTTWREALRNSVLEVIPTKGDSLFVLFIGEVVVDKAPGRFRPTSKKTDENKDGPASWRFNWLKANGSRFPRACQIEIAELSLTPPGSREVLHAKKEGEWVRPDENATTTRFHIDPGSKDLVAEIHEGNLPELKTSGKHTGKSKPVKANSQDEMNKLVYWYLDVGINNSNNSIEKKEKISRVLNSGVNVRLIGSMNGVRFEIARIGNLTQPPPSQAAH